MEGEETSIDIKNIKISVKLKGQSTITQLLEKCSQHAGVTHHVLSSFIVVKKLASSWRFIIFKSKPGAQRHHTNITGLKCMEEIEHSLSFLAHLLLLNREDLTFRIDNITSKSQGLEKYMLAMQLDYINLQVLMAQLMQNHGPEITCRFQPQVYSALVVKLFNTTNLIYEKGAILVIGARDVPSSIQSVTAIVKAACPANMTLLS